MAENHSFDIVSKIDLFEVKNALNQTIKEMRERFDFKGSKSTISLEEGKIVIITEDEFKLRNLNELLKEKMIKRNISLKALEFKKPEPTFGGMVKQQILIQQGIPEEKCKEIVKFIKKLNKKVQAQIQKDQIRVFSPKIDQLQEIIKELKEQDFGIFMQFTNYR